MHTFPLTLVVATGLCAAAGAQSPTRTAPLQPQSAAIAIDPTGVVTDTAADGTLWAAGPTWKASFAADGTTFVPCFGSQAPRNFPANLARATATVGGKVLPSEPVAPTFAFAAVEYRGALFTERYALRDAGIEQQFVFATLPQRGVLEVSVPVASELALTGHTADGGFRFGNEHGSFGYGRAVAIDADGDRLDLATEWTGSGFRITVPAEFVSAATLPLLIDPLLGGVVAVATDTRELDSTDLAWDESMARHAVVYEKVFSATDSDVYCRYVDGAMAVAGAPVAIDLSTDSWRKPQVAALEAHDRFLVVAQKSIGNVAPFAGIGRLVTGLSATLSTPIPLLVGVGNVHHLDVGGDPSPVAPTQFLVVAEVEFSPTDHDIHLQPVQAVGIAGASRLVDGLSLRMERPQVSKTCGLPGGNSEVWGIAYRQRVSATDFQARFACVDRTFTVVQSTVPVGGVLPAADFEVAISSPTDHADGRRCGYFLQHSIAPAGMEMRFGIVDRTGILVAPTSEGTNSWNIHGRASVETDGLRFLVTHTVSNPTNTHQRAVHFGLFSESGGTVDVQQWESELNLDYAPSAVVRRTTVGGGGQATVAWVRGGGAVPYEVRVKAYGMYQEGAQFATRFTSCGNLGFLHGGSSALGESVSLQLVQAAGLVGWVVGLPVDLPVGPCPGCRQGVSGSVVLGAATQWTVPRNAAFVGITVAFQGFQFVPSGQSGACLGQVNLTNTLDATVR